MRIKRFTPFVILLSALAACQESKNENGETAIPAIQIKDREMLVGKNIKDTMYVQTTLGVASLEEVTCTSLSGDTENIPFGIDTLYKKTDNEIAIVFSDRGMQDVYNLPARVSIPLLDESGRITVTDTFLVCKPFFTRLPVVYIDTPRQAEVTSKEDWMENTSLKIYDEKGTLEYDKTIEIKGRGNSTWSFPKKPYALKLDKKAEILGMPEHKRWVLLANYLDKTLMRNHIAFFLAQAEGISLEWTPRGRFVDVVFNGKHAGTYYLCEQIKIDEHRVNIHENTPEDTDGGFLIEMDTNFDEVNKFRSETSNLPVMVKEPDEDDLTDGQFTFVEDYVNRIDSLLYSSDFSTTREYAQYIDVQTFVDYYLIFQLTGNAELSWPKSFYMHKDQGRKFKAGPVWDFDYRTFGPLYQEYFQGKVPDYRMWWFRRLHEDPAVNELRIERWNTLRPSFEEVFQEIEDTRKLIRISAEANDSLWAIEPDINEEESLTFDEAVDRLRDNLAEQMEWIDTHIED